MAAFAVPVLWWNSRHGWVGFRHVAGQLDGAGRKHGYWRELASNVGVLVGGQAGAVGLGLVPVMADACAYAWRANGEPPAVRDRLHFLLAIGLTFLGLNAAACVTTKIQPNWPAPAYFTLLILTGYFLTTRAPRREPRIPAHTDPRLPLRSPAHPDAWHRWRGWVYGTVLTAPLIVLISHQPQLLYPPLARLSRMMHRPPSVRWLAFFAKQQGNAEMCRIVSAELAALRPGAFVMCEDYQQTALAAFYRAGQPTTYYFGSYKRVNPGRWCQYDLWPGLEQPALLGRDTVYLGQDDPALRAAFDRVERLDDIVIRRAGVEVRRFHPWACHGYKGITRPGGTHGY